MPLIAVGSDRTTLEILPLIGHGVSLRGAANLLLTTSFRSSDFPNPMGNSIVEISGIIFDHERKIARPLIES